MQNTKINLKSSSWRKCYLEETKICSSSSGRLVLIITEIDFARYADDHTPYVSNYRIDDVIKLLEDESLSLFIWFTGNPSETNNAKLYECKKKKKNAENSICMKIQQQQLKSDADLPHPIILFTSIKAL